MIKRIGKRKTVAGGRKEERIVLVRVRTKYLDSSSVFLPPAPLGSERKIKNIKSKKEKAGNLFIILRMVEIKESKEII